MPPPGPPRQPSWRARVRLEAAMGSGDGKRRKVFAEPGAAVSPGRTRQGASRHLGAGQEAAPVGGGCFEVFHDRHRRHTSLGGFCPANFGTRNNGLRIQFPRSVLSKQAHSPSSVSVRPPLRSGRRRDGARPDGDAGPRSSRGRASTRGHITVSPRAGTGLRSREGTSGWKPPGRCWWRSGSRCADQARSRARR